MAILLLDCHDLTLLDDAFPNYVDILDPGGNVGIGLAVSHIEHDVTDGVTSDCDATFHI